MKRIAPLLLLALLLAGLSPARAAGPYNAAPTGTPAYVAAPTGFGQQLSQSTGSYLTISGDPMGFPAGTAWTFEQRGAMTATPSGYSVSRLGTGSGNLALGVDTPGNIEAVIGFSGGLQFIHSAVAAAGANHAVALVCVPGANAAANSVVTLYVDGAASGTATGVWNPGTGAGVDQIGAFNGNSGTGGTIDEVAISTVAQYTANYTPATAPFAASRTGQVANYHLDGSGADSNSSGAAAATSYTLTGPSALTQGQPGTYTVTPSGQFTGTITPSLSGVAGTTSGPLSFSGTSAPQSFTVTASAAGSGSVSATSGGALTDPAPVSVTVSAPPVTIPVSSPAFYFAPGWTGDTGRGGSAYRQTSYPGQYFRFAWTAGASAPSLSLSLDTSVYGSTGHAPDVAYQVDGAWANAVAATGNVSVSVAGAGPHLLTLYVKDVPFDNRWGGATGAQTSALRVTGATLDGGSTPGTASFAAKWVLFVADSNGEGQGKAVQGDTTAGANQEDATLDWTALTGRALQAQGYEYGMSALSGTGWVTAGNSNSPGLYVVSGSTGGAGGTYSDAASRWNKIDGTHSLLDSAGHLSAYGGTGQEPSAVVVNMMTNEALQAKSLSDSQASVAQALPAYRGAAPSAQILSCVPWPLYATSIFSSGPAYVSALKSGVAAYQSASPADAKVSLVDLGPSVSAALASSLYGGSIHDNALGDAFVAPQATAAILAKLTPAAASASAYRGQIRRGR